MVNIDDFPMYSFTTPYAWRAWLSKHHSMKRGIWIRFFKKASGKPTISYQEALDQALCFGWIDGLVKKYDNDSYVQRFLPRRPKSLWSKRNTFHIKRLIKTGLMTAVGLNGVKQAKADGRWKAAYDSAKTIKPPTEFLTALEKNKTAKTFYETLNKTNTYTILWKITTAKKQETKLKRIDAIIAMLTKKQKLF